MPTIVPAGNDLLLDWSPPICAASFPLWVPESELGLGDIVGVDVAWKVVEDRVPGSEEELLVEVEVGGDSVCTVLLLDEDRVGVILGRALELEMLVEELGKSGMERVIVKVIGPVSVNPPPSMMIVGGEEEESSGASTSVGSACASDVFGSSSSPS
ncbi:hypothetical protein CPC08DRAFT_770623 [Agrocybe pediades]|nr:hypothetical protein CPC08DRAFT_770623 [Agrocybe pediades]